MRKFAGKLYRRFAPSDVQGCLDCRRARPHWARQDVIFIHVPKAAGISISNALYGKALGHIEAERIRRYANEEFESLFKFAFVRHPVSRLISAISYVRENHKALKGGPGLPSAEEIFLDPEEFVTQWLALQNMDRVNFVFREQSSFVLNKGGDILVDHLARYENFDEEVAKLSGLVPELKNLERLNSSKSSEVNYSVSQLNEALKSVYHRDYELLGYE